MSAASPTAPKAKSKSTRNATRESKDQEKDKERDTSKEEKLDRLKTVVRRLPPNLPEDVFWQSVQTWVTDENVNWKVFYAGKVRTRWGPFVYFIIGISESIQIRLVSTRRISLHAPILHLRMKSSLRCSVKGMMDICSEIKQVRAFVIVV